MTEGRSVFSARDREMIEAHLRERSGPLADAVSNLLHDHSQFDVRRRDLEMVRRMATYGPGAGTTPEQALKTIEAWAEKKLAKIEVSP